MQHQGSDVVAASQLVSTVDFERDPTLASKKTIPEIPDSTGEKLRASSFGQRLLFGTETHEYPQINERRKDLQSKLPDSYEDPTRHLIFRDMTRLAEPVLAQESMVQRMLRPIPVDRTATYAGLITAATSDPRADALAASQGAVVARADGRRADYAKIEGSAVTEALQGLARAVTYNSAVGLGEIATLADKLRENSSHDPRAHNRDIENGINISMHWPELEAVREANAHARRENGVRVWLPCHAEPGAAHLNLAYAAEMVDSSRITCVNTNRYQDPRVLMTQQDLGRQAHNAPDVTLGLQDRLLACVDWAQVEEHFCLQLQRDDMGQVVAPAGSKGMTLLAIALVEEARQTMKGSYVLMHDTDIINPWQYNAIEYMSVPLHQGNGAPALIDRERGWGAVYLARTGQGRNNQPVHGALNGILSDRNEDALSRELAANCLLTPWLLTGERMIRGDLMRRMPWVNDMTIESQINVLLAGEARHRGKLSIAHVMNPMPKIENADVAASREWRMINYCAQHHRDLIQACSSHGLVPAAWTDREIRLWNTGFARFNSVGTITNDASHTANTAYASSRPWMLPSIDMLRQMHLVDWSRVLEVASMDTSLLKRGLSVTGA